MMGNQWVKELETVAKAVLSNAEFDDGQGCSCKHCGAKAASANSYPDHSPDCPVVVAKRIVDQAVFMRQARPLI